jgi:hypothetical protein
MSYEEDYLMRKVGELERQAASAEDFLIRQVDYLSRKAGEVEDRLTEVENIIKAAQARRVPNSGS